MLRILPFLIPITIVLAGCESDETETASAAQAPVNSPGRLFLGPKDMSPPSGVVSIPEASISDVISGEIGFYLRPAEASTTNDECQKQLGRTVKVKASRSELSIDGSGVAQDCVPNGSDPNTTISKAQLRVQVYLQCNDTDLSAYDGQAYHEFKLAELKCGDGLMTYALQYNSSQISKSPDLELRSDISFRATQFRSDGTPCRIIKTGAGSRIDECVHSRTSVASGVSASGAKAASIPNPRSLFPTSFGEFTWRGVEFAKPSNRLFSSGKIEFKIQNWTGTMNFAGSNPKWSATDGKSNKDGSFGATNQ